MAQTYKILGQQLFLSGNSSATLYTVPSSTTTVISSIIVANQSSSQSGSFALQVVKAGEATDPYATYAPSKQIIAGNVSLAKSSMMSLSAGLTLSAGDKIVAYGDLSGTNAAFSFNAFGVENS